MVIRIASLYRSLPAGSAETDIDKLTCPVGHTYKVLEILPLVASNSLLYIYIESDRIATIHGDILAKDNRRILVDWTLTGGQTLYVRATNGSTSSALEGVIIIFEDTVAT